LSRRVVPYLHHGQIIERHSFSRTFGNRLVKSQKPYWSGYTVSPGPFKRTFPPIFPIRGKDLEELVGITRESTVTIVLDEVNLGSQCQALLIIQIKFYSWYIYPDHERDVGKSISSAEYINDVNKDSVIIIDGLTKVPPPYA
jgi:hypothetical protein